MTFVRPRNADPLVAAAEEAEVNRRLFADDTDPESLERKRKILSPRHDEALLRIYLSSMPLGKYHVRDDDTCALYRDGKPVLFLSDDRHDGALMDFDQIRGCIAALVHLLNTREQTVLGNGTAPR